MTTSQFDWTDDACAELRRLWMTDAWSCSEISTMLIVKFGGNVSRNAVIGKVCRLGLPRRTEGRRTDLHADRLAPRRPRLPNFRAVRPKEAAIELPPEPTPATAVPFMDLGPHHCRWPLGDPGPDLLFCGAVPTKDKPYCAWHCRMAYQPARNDLSRLVAA